MMCLDVKVTVSCGEVKELLTLRSMCCLTLSPYNSCRRSWGSGYCRLVTTTLRRRRGTLCNMWMTTA